MIYPINSLMNMEMALYGGFGSNANAPSYLNNYMGASNNFANYYNPAFMGYGSYPNYNQANGATFGQTIPAGYTAQGQAQQSASIFQGLSNTETQALMNDYVESLSPSEGFAGCLVGNAVFAGLMNPRLVAHPYNTFKAITGGTITDKVAGKTFNFNGTNAVFADVKKAGSALNKAWVGTGANAAEVAAQNSNILREAWLQHNKAVSRCRSKAGLFRRTFQETGAGATSEVELVLKKVAEHEAAIKSGDIQRITKTTAELQQMYSVNQGFFQRGWNGVKGLFTDVQHKGVKEALADSAAIASKEAALKETTKAARYKDILARGGGVKGGLFFMGIEFLLGFGKIKTAFQEDKKTGWKQVGQTTVKGAGNAAGWALGEAAGVWAFTKFGAKIGSKVHPLLGTLIGGAVGLIGGGLGMWLAGKGTKALVGQDVADKVEAKKLAQSTEGQVQLLQNTMQRMQSGEKVSADAQMAVQKLVAQYA